MFWSFCYSVYLACQYSIQLKRSIHIVETASNNYHFLKSIEEHTQFILDCGHFDIFQWTCQKQKYNENKFTENCSPKKGLIHLPWHDLIYFIRQSQCMQRNLSSLQMYLLTKSSKQDLFRWFDFFYFFVYYLTRQYKKQLSRSILHTY